MAAYLGQVTSSHLICRHPQQAVASPHRVKRHQSRAAVNNLAPNSRPLGKTRPELLRQTTRCRARQPSNADATAEEEAEAAEAAVVEDVPDALRDPNLREEVIARAKSVLGDRVTAEELDLIVDKLSAADQDPSAQVAGQAALAAAEAELKAQQAQYLRLSADFDNFRKRTDTEKVALRERARGDVVEQLFPLVDSFEQAKSQLKAETEGEQKIEGAYQGVYKQVLDIFRSLGVEPVPGEGQPFDPALHDGIMRTETDDVPDGTILKEFRRGFLLGDRLLRPAMVQVSYSSAAAESSNGSHQEAGSAAESSTS